MNLDAAIFHLVGTRLVIRPVLGFEPVHQRVIMKKGIWLLVGYRDDIITDCGICFTE